MRRRRRSLIAFLALLLPAVAHAHAMLRRSDPPDGAQLRAAPTAMTLWFTEPLEPRFSRVEVRDESGTALAVQPPQPLPGDNSGLTAGLPALAAGRYHLRWTVISIDSHRTTGTVSFTIQP